MSLPKRDREDAIKVEAALAGAIRNFHLNVFSDPDKTDIASLYMRLKFVDKSLTNQEVMQKLNESTLGSRHRA